MFSSRSDGTNRSERNVAVPVEEVKADKPAEVDETAQEIHKAPRAVEIETTDIHLNMDSPEKSLIYPGPRVVTGGDLAMARSLIEKIRSITRKDFMVDHDGRFWRGRDDSQAVDGRWCRMRLISGSPPELHALPSPMHENMVQTLMHPGLSRGGLIYVCGGTGCGKTTTASAIVVSRLKALGGLAYTVEEPPEMPLNGWHGKGYCTQTWVAGDDSVDWQESMRGVLRSQPAKTPVMLYIGEVRDQETGIAMLRAANNGFLVIATGFGSDIVSGIDAFVGLVGKDSKTAISSALRAVVYQRIDHRFYSQIMVSSTQNSAVGNLIRNGQLAQLQSEIEYQQSLMLSGGNLWEM